MPIVVSLDKKKKVISIQGKGAVNATILKDVLKSIRKYYDQGYTKALVDATQQEEGPTTMDIYDFAVATTQEFRHLKQAIFMSNRTTKEVRFLETLIRNRGGMIKLFQSEDEALAWLYDNNATD